MQLAAAAESVILAPGIVPLQLTRRAVRSTLRPTLSYELLPLPLRTGWI